MDSYIAVSSTDEMVSEVITQSYEGCEFDEETEVYTYKGDEYEALKCDVQRLPDGVYVYEIYKIEECM